MSHFQLEQITDSRLRRILREAIAAVETTETAGAKREGETIRALIRSRINANVTNKALTADLRAALARAEAAEAERKRWERLYQKAVDQDAEQYRRLAAVEAERDRLREAAHVAEWAMKKAKDVIQAKAEWRLLSDARRKIRAALRNGEDRQP